MNEEEEEKKLNKKKIQFKHSIKFVSNWKEKKRKWKFTCRRFFFSSFFFYFVTYFTFLLHFAREFFFWFNFLSLLLHLLYLNKNKKKAISFVASFQLFFFSLYIPLDSFFSMRKKILICYRITNSLVLSVYTAVVLPSRLSN